MAIQDNSIFKDHGFRWAKKALRLALDTVLPRLCPACQGELPGQQWICLSCRRRFRPVPPGEICFRCREHTRESGDREAGYPCRLMEHEPWRGRAVFWMEKPLDQVIHAFKYENRPDLSRPLGRLLSQGPRQGPETLVVPVPLHRLRFRERRYNQAALLGKVLAEKQGLPIVTAAIQRQLATAPQARLPESRRRANVNMAFAVSQPALIRGRSFLLIDDVATTGSTLMAAARTLYDGGADRVTPMVLALA